MLIPAISFQGNCENAIKFYQEALDAQIKSIVYASEAPVDSGLDPETVSYTHLTLPTKA